MDTDRMSDYRLNADASFEIWDYREKPLFFSFLPGIAGVHGMPVWAFYTNRGQCLCSFGIESKQRSIMEYFPANQAAERVALQGFRTFLRVDGRFYEPFACGASDEVHMTIHQNHLALTSRDERSGMEVGVVYFIATDCPYPALIRRVRIANRSGKSCRIEAADGMPRIIPCGISNAQYKAEGNTFSAWADTRRLPSGGAFFGVKQSLKDAAEITQPKDGFFCAAFADNIPCPVVVDPAVIFGSDASMQRPLGFITHGSGVIRQPQYMVNRMPCAFAVTDQLLEQGQTAPSGQRFWLR